jgi:hypothetical protein
LGVDLAIFGKDKVALFAFTGLVSSLCIKSGELASPCEAQ